MAEGSLNKGNLQMNFDLTLIPNHPASNKSSQPPTIQIPVGAQNECQVHGSPARFPDSAVGVSDPVSGSYANALSAAGGSAAAGGNVASDGVGPGAVASACRGRSKFSADAAPAGAVLMAARSGKAVRGDSGGEARLLLAPLFLL
ncbi:hypothetical protein SUGI_0348900 [Cryptomeria japonica]|nr:hypothetical protein SUGI_0348900 [Cryptomeria japonica]